MDLEFLKDLYFDELARRDRLDETPTRLVAVLSLLSAVFLFYFRNFDFDSAGLTWFFALCVLAAVALFVAAVGLIVRASVGFSYLHLGLADAYEAYRTDLQSFYATSLSPSNAIDQAIEVEVAAAVRVRLVAATARNAQRNNQRSELFYQAKLSLVGLLVITALSGLPVLVQVVQRRAN